eukprot:GILK01001570.1.p1 GENE.GILK01001570.1~~GILK01001570.1.p1  ORF type:complete len:443 (-),score=66.71 GILK01001570.1:170-1465(-)
MEPAGSMQTPLEQNAFAVQHIQFDIAQPQAAHPSLLDMERQKHERRAQKFGVDLQEPNPKLYMHPSELKKASLNKQPGFITGIDLFSEEERRKREARAAKYGVDQDSEFAPSLRDREQKKNRAQRFNLQIEDQLQDGMELDHWTERKEAVATAPVRNNAVHVFGVDLMSTKDVLGYFREYGPSWVEWIDDSSCNVEFEDEFSARRAFENLTLPLGMDEQQAETSAMQLGQTLPWRRGVGCTVNGKSHVLQMRIATEADRKSLMTKASDSKYYQYVRETKGYDPRAKVQQRNRQRQHHHQDVVIEEADEGDVTMEGTRKRKQRSRGGKGRKRSVSMGMEVDEGEMERRQIRASKFGLESDAAAGGASETTQDPEDLSKRRKTGSAGIFKEEYEAELRSVQPEDAPAPQWQANVGVAGSLVPTATGDVVTYPA